MASPVETSGSAAQFALSLLGSTQLLRLDGEAGPRTVLGNGKPLALIAFLQCAPARTASREQLLELLWSDADAEAARHTLRQTLWYIRRRLGVDPFTTPRDGIHLAISLDSDRDAFLAALDANEPDVALAHYHGDFFPDFAVPGGAAFEHWADLERARLRALFVGAATRVVRDRLAKGHAREAVAAAKHARDLAPTHQVSWRLLLESMLAADDIVGAAVEVERLRQWLAEDEVEADAATLQLMKLAASGRAPIGEVESADRGVLQSELVGRESEFAVLLSAFEMARRGSYRHVHISGPAGFGKTRLLDGFAARLRSRRVRVVTARGTPGERALPFAFAAHLVSAMVGLRGAAAVSPDTARTLVALAPSASSHLAAEPDRSTGDDAIRRRSLAVIDLVTALAHDAPLVLLIDDVHWIDANSRTILASLAARAEGVAVLLVTAARPHDRFRDDAPGATSLALSGLSADDVGALVMSIGRLPQEPWADAFVTGLHTSADGSPLLVLESLQLLLERNHLELRDQEWRSPDPALLLSTLRRGGVLRHRIEALPADAQHALTRLSLAGTDVDESTLSHLFTAGERDALGMLESRGLVTRDGASWRVVHDEIAAMATEIATPDRRTAMHAEIASHLERDAGRDTPMLLRSAQHWSRAADTRALGRVFARAVRSAELRGEPAIRELAREILGVGATSVDVEQLVATVPWRRRHLPRHWVSGLMLAASIVLVASNFILRGVGAPPASTTSRLTLADEIDGRRQLLDVEIDPDHLTSDEPLDVGRVRSDVFPARVTDSVVVTGSLPDGRHVGTALMRHAADNDHDLVVINTSGAVGVLLDRPRDQVAPAASPDGRYVAYLSGEYHEQQRNDIAMLDLSRNVVTRLTYTDASEKLVRWSPDGSRLAFVRSHAMRRPAEVCWLSIVDLRERCGVLDTTVHVPSQVLAWSGDFGVLVEGKRLVDQQPFLATFDVRTGRYTVLDSSGAAYVADPSGRIVLCRCRVDGYAGDVLAAFGPNTSDRKRVLHRGGEPLRASLATLALWNVRRRYLDAITIRGPTQTFAGQRVQYTVSGRDPSGDSRAVPYVAWHSLDSTVATTDSLGIVVTRQPGTARLVAFAGGGRSDTLAIDVSPRTDSVVLHETWRERTDVRWLDFGEPRPVVATSRSGMALRINGDANLTSGVVSRTALDATRGAGLSARVRLPVTVAQWQRITIGFQPVADEELARWRERGRSAVPDAWRAGLQQSACLLSAPGEEGGENLDLVSLLAGGEAVRFPRRTPRITDSSWHVITLQLFADGRCGVAIDGAAVAISSGGLVLANRPLRIWIDGQSVGTTIEVGLVEAWTGVRADVDWSAVMAPVTTGDPARPGG